ncbi:MULTISPECIES: PrsW family glutamic-type intramembrane protease [Actinomyces]|uniref:PrsW family intramembrane metalloprotease n=1 Tax=Actinomyces respiraculi TaxID=2744574 RepID=A0A7T0LL61_9ACTO|nr:MULTISPECIES: PrsW family glutamic-type intramembrane protease [Actinomyces]QPL05637.1 PrsW family intramembrane metalloprotease [Actinomyces respiraculi]
MSEFEPFTHPGGQSEPRREWWEDLGARLAGARTLAPLRRVRVVVTWAALVVVLIAVAVWPLMRTALGAWVGCVWAMAAWFLLARAKTVSWSLVSGVFSVGMVLAPLAALVSARLALAAEVSVSSASAAVVVASLVEETLKLVPLVALGLIAPGRTRRLLVSDWLVLGVACGTAFTTVEETARRLVLLGKPSGLFDLLTALACPSTGTEALECRGISVFSLNPISGAAGEYVMFAGHGVVTGLIAGAAGLALVTWRRASRLGGARRVLARAGAGALVAGAWWMAVVDHMGRNGSYSSLWSRTGGEAPWWPVGATATLTGNGHGRGLLLFVMLAIAWVVDVRTLWASGYTLSLEGDDGGGRWGRWRWRTWHRLPGSAWLRLPGSGWRALAADVVDLVATTALEVRAVLMSVREAQTTRRPGLPTETLIRLRLARQDAAREQLDPPPEQWWRTRVAAACAAVLGLLVLTTVPPLTHSLAVSLGETDVFWLAGVLEGLADVWDSLSWGQKGLLLLVAGAIVVLSGGTLGMALNVGMGLMTVMSALRGGAAFLRDPRGAVRSYLATHTPGEIAAEVALWVLTSLGGGVLGYLGGQAGRLSYYAYRESRWGAYLWRHNRHAWHSYAAERRAAVRRFLRDETGGARPGHPSNDLTDGTHYPGVRSVPHGHADGGPGAWGPGCHHVGGARGAWRRARRVGAGQQQRLATRPALRGAGHRRAGAGLLPRRRDRVRRLGWHYSH